MAAFKISPDALDRLSRWNRIADSVWSLDGILRVGSYSCLLGATYLTEFNAGKPTPLAEFLSGVFGKVTDARFINRVMAWPATLESVFHYANNPDNSSLGVLGQVMTWSMVAYYPLEHGWLLSTFKPQMVNIDGNKWSLWSCRFWAVYVVCDLLGTYIREQSVSEQIGKLSADERDKLAELKKQQRNLRIWYTCALCDLVMAVQWSVAQGPFSTKQICGVGIYGGVAGLYLKWLKSRKN